jgi:4-amino-4-deoxy-L-arabinose transferase-like glycosyltransferase
MRNKKLFYFIAVAIVICVAGFFRLWDLNTTPPGLYPDLAINGINALDTAHSGDFKVFYPDNNGREGLVIWLEALLFMAIGPSILALKLVAVFFGLLTVWGTYLLVVELLKYIDEKQKEEINKFRLIGIIASFFMAISFWHVNFSRFGFRAIMVPFFIVFGFYFFFKGFTREKKVTTKEIVNLLASGIFFGLGFYTYISYRFVVLIGLAVLICLWFVYKKLKITKQFWQSVMYLAIAMVIVSLPIGIYFAFHPADFFGRASDVSVMNQGIPLLVLGKSLGLHLAMFNFYGDANWRHNYASSPELIWPVGIFFLVGIILSIIDLRESIKKKNLYKITGYVFLFSWFISMLLPGFLSGEGVPHALRTIGVIPVAHIFAGIGAYWLIFDVFGKICRTKRDLYVFVMCLVLFVVALTYASYDIYFNKWGKSNETKGAFTQDLSNIGDYLNSLPDNVNKYVVVTQGGTLVNGIPMPAQTPIFLERLVFGEPRAKYLLPSDIDKINKTTLSGPTTFVIMSYDADTLSKLFINFPISDFNSSLKQKNGFWVYEFDAGQLVSDYKATGCGCNKTSSN